MKVQLRDDPLPDAYRLAGTIPRVMVKRRVKVGVDADGVGEHDWQPVIDTDAILAVKRTITDSETGAVTVEATLTIVHDGAAAGIRETDHVTTALPGGEPQRWRVVSVTDRPLVAELECRREVIAEGRQP